MSAVIALADVALVDNIVSGQLSDTLEHERLRVNTLKLLALMSEVVVLGQSDGRWDDIVDEGLNGVVLEEVQHPSGRDLAVSNMSVDEGVRLLDLVRNPWVLHDLDLLLEHVLGDEHLVVQLKAGQLRTLRCSALPAWINCSKRSDDLSLRDVDLREDRGRLREL